MVRRQLRWLATAGLLAVAAWGGWLLHGWRQPAAPAVVTATPAPARLAQAAGGQIGCLGRFQPDDDVVRVAAPYFQSRPSLVERLLVKEGDWVRSGQVLAYLDGKPQVEAERNWLQSNLNLARVRIAQARAGAKLPSIEAQRSEIARLSSVVRFEQSRLERAEQLFSSGDISAADRDLRRTAHVTSQQALEQAQHQLRALEQARPEDVSVAETELELAQSRLAEVAVRLRSLTVTAPVSGQVVKIYARSGEQAGANGILDLADTKRMAAEAEVYATDVALVRPGQSARIEMEGGARTMPGEVVRLGSAVRQAAVLPLDPVAYSDAHVVPVRIRVPGCAETPCPIGARVKIIIETMR